MHAGIWGALGELLGSAFLGYACVLCGGCLGLHLLAGIVHARYRRRCPGVALVIELIYGLLHPVLYLVVLEPAFFRRTGDVRIQAVSWTLLFLYWAFRVGGSAIPLSEGSLRRCGAWMAGSVGIWVAAMGIRDGIVGSQMRTDSNLGPVVQVLLCSPLYLVPLWIVGSQWRATRSPEGWRTSNLLLGSRRSAKVLVAACGVALAGFVALASVRPSDSEIRASILSERSAILDVARTYQIDPRLIAALAFVTQRDTTTPFRARLEQTAAGAWLVDSKSHFGLAKGLDPSVGLTQIKPVTLATARVIRRKSDDPNAYCDKQEREVPDAGDAWETMPSPALRRVPFAPWIQEQDKAALVEGLLTPARNLEACAFLLDLYATQWEAANAAWSIRDRPEILATLFQIGFQHSQPKAHPRPNDFGQAVAEAMRDPWIQAHFTPAP